MSAVAAVVELHQEPHEVGSYDPNRATPTAEQYAAFEVAFEHFNNELFGGKLPPVLLTLAKSGRSFGYYHAARWRRRGEKDGRVGEIALSPDHLGREERAAAGTLVHEMTHHWQHVAGKPSRRGYHNREWADRMEALGLMPSNTGEPGGKRTGQRMTHYIMPGAAFERAYEKLPEGVLLPFIAGSSSTEDKPRPKTPDPSKTKYVCSGCGMNAWAKPEAGLVHCEVPMAVAR